MRNKKLSVKIAPFSRWSVMNLFTRVTAIFILLCSSTAMAINGSNAFVCDLIRYSTDPNEVREATQEASKRGICGHAKPAPQADPAANPKTERKADREKAGKGLFIGAALVCIAKGKCEHSGSSTHNQRR